MDQSTLTLRRALLAFYRDNARDLPWRRTRDPYAIWVSEIMLQQTRVDTVVPRYREFLARYPSVRALAAASESEVCEAWAGLGYYRRARSLHAAARRVVDDNGGALPQDARSLMALPGIGRYTAGAIASIAFGEEAPVVDGNVDRVLSRVFAIEGHSADKDHVRAVWDHATRLVRGATPGDLNQAIMELGATLCTPRNPGCERCPVAAACSAWARGEVGRFPTPAPKAPRRPLAIAFAWIEGPRGIWLEQRGMDGLWPGLWELPSAQGRGAKSALAQSLGVELGRPAATVTHTLTHRDVTARVYVPKSAPKLRRSATRRPFGEPLAAPLSALCRKALIAMAARL